MKPYVFGEREGVYIIDLTKTVPLANNAYEFLKTTAASERCFICRNEKRQAQDTVKKAAEACGAFHITNRWLGGMLTNYKTIALFN